MGNSQDEEPSKCQSDKKCEKSPRGIGLREHPGVPLIGSWGVFIPISYGRPDFKQASLEEVQSKGIDFFTKWGANLVDLYPTNKERHIPQESVSLELTVKPEHVFREYPDADQENRWTEAEFLALNHHAHENDFLISLFLTYWGPSSYAERARFFWRLLRQIAQDFSDVVIDGFSSHYDGFAIESDFIMPAEANELLWPYHPGMFLREASWGLNCTVANLLQCRGFHINDGRMVLYNDEDYVGMAPECWRGYEAIWRGKEVKLQGGRLYTDLQVEGRDLAPEGRALIEYGGMGRVDMLIEQVSNFARAKGRGWTTAGTAAIRVINEAHLSPKMKRYVGGICGDPIRCAIVGELESTGTDGRFPRVDYPNGTWFCQNNHFRVYIDKDTGRTSVHLDRAGEGNFSNFLWDTSARLLDDLLTSKLEPGEQLTFHEFWALEEAGAAALLRERMEYRRGADSMAEFRDFSVEADNPWLRVRVQRIFNGRRTERRATTTLKLPGYRLAGEPAQDRTMVFVSAGEENPIWVYVEPCEQVESLEADEGRLQITCRPDASHDLRFAMRFGHAEPDSDRRDEDARFNAIELRGDWESRREDELLFHNDTSCRVIRAARISTPPAGPYMVCENGWWQPRGAQPSRHETGTDLLKLVLWPNQPTRVRAYGYLDGLVKSGWGCQYTQLLRDIAAAENGARVTVRVLDIGPLIWAPRLRFCRQLADARIDGREWHYFSGPFLFLPNHRRDYKVEVRFGPPVTPHLTSTFACVESTSWDGRRLGAATSLPEWCDEIPAGSHYYLAVDNAGFKLDSVEGGRSVRSVPDFSAARPMPMSGPDGVVRLVPRYYHHPHLDGYRAAKGDVIAFQPPVELAFSFAPSCSGPANCPSHVFGI